MAAARKSKTFVPGGFGAGVGAAVAMMLVMAVLRLTTNTVSIPELMEESLIRLTGGRVEAFFINNLGVGGKALLLVTIVEGTLLLGGILGLLFTRFWPASNPTFSSRWLSGLLYGLLIGLLLNVVVLPIVNQGLFGSDAIGVTAPPEIAKNLYGTSLAPFGLPVALNMFLLSVVFGLALVALLPWNRRVTVATPAAVATPAVATPAIAQPAQAATYADVPSTERRDFLKVAGGTVVAIAGGAVLWTVIRAALAPPPVAGVGLVEDNGSDATNTPQTGDTPLPASTAAAGTTEVASTPGAEMAGFENVKPLLVPEVTPNDSFYITTKNFIDPTVDANSWSLSFKGLVDNPYTINYKDLLAMPATERYETLSCISNPVGGDLIGNAKWKGVSFLDLLQKAKPKQGAVDVVVRAVDGYADSFPMDVALHNDLFLAYQMNGAPLPGKHGFPARLLVPNIYGMKNCKWITEVELVNNDFMGYWEAQGWDDVAHYQTLSRIDYPNTDNIPAKPVYITGIAWAGNRGIKKVEVSIDGGKSWNAADLRPPLGQNTWVLWTYPWKPKAGVYNLMVRATDGTGAVQSAMIQDTYPSGATGYDARQVRVG